MSDIQPVTLPNPSQVIFSGILLSFERVSAVQWAVPCQQPWHQVHAIGCMAGMLTTCVSERTIRAQASAQPTTPLKYRKSIMDESFSWRQLSPVGPRSVCIGKGVE
jgi:hypothetical protein